MYKQVVSENAHLGLLPYRPPVYTNVQTGLLLEYPERAHYFGMPTALHICFKQYEQPAHGIRDASQECCSPCQQTQPMILIPRPCTGPVPHARFSRSLKKKKKNEAPYKKLTVRMKEIALWVSREWFFSYKHSSGFIC